MKIKAQLKPGKVALVTGGSSGIGKAIACGLAERGMHVWLVAQRKDVLESARKEVETHRKDANQIIGVVATDISEWEQVRIAVKQVTEKSGPPDLLVNSAGVTHPGYVEKLDLNIFSWMMEVNYFGTVYMTKEMLPAMIKRGSGYILNISSGAGYVGIFGYSAYAASKYAVRGFSDVLRQEMKLHGIGVSTMFPADTDTPQLAYESEFKPPETKALGSIAGAMSAEDVARVAIKGIERGKYYIFPNFELKFFTSVSELARGIFDFGVDQIIASANKKKNSSQVKEA
jgi:3-dehydrosphinganine reductase